MKKIIVFLTVIVSFFSLSIPAFAHVVVKPNQVGVGAFQTFTMGVPNEKDNATVALRLVMPEGLEFVSPTVKPGWKIEIKKTGEGDTARVTEILWTDGQIPEGQRDDFSFSAKVPSKETALNWKAYQTYSNGTIVTWDQPSSVDMSDAQKEDMEKKGLGPYSTTQVVNDLKNESSPVMTNSETKMSKVNSELPFVLSLAAILISIVSVGMELKKKK